MMRITDALAVHAQTRPTILAASDAQGQLTWLELHHAVAAREAMLLNVGVRPGDRVAVCVPDGITALVTILAVLRLGAVHAPVDVSLAAPEIIQALADVQAQWLVRPATHAPTDTTWKRDAELAVAAVDYLAPAVDPLAPADSAFIRLTSGTTGASKGVLLSHATLRERIDAARIILGIGPMDVVLWLLPMAYHVAVSILLYIDAGVSIIFGNRLRVSATAACAVTHQCTCAYASPWHVRRLAELPSGSLPASLRRIISTTTALDVQAGALARQRHGVVVQQALGIIECGLPLLSAGIPDEPVGLFRVHAPYQARVVRAEREADGRGIDCAIGEPGELWLAGPGFVDAYVDPWQTRAEIMHEGHWFATGDQAQLMPDGQLQLLGRLKDVINVGGVKVFPQEVEIVLSAHPAVAACRVRAHHDSRTGEQVAAEVQLIPGTQLDSIVIELQGWCRDRLAPLKRPAVITVVDALAMTPSGKVRR